MLHLRQINLNSLRIVESAARLGNFTRAGEEQLITASAVSQRIKNLEDQLRFRIFHRRSNAVLLTAAGEAFVSHVREALDKILEAGLEVSYPEREKVLKISVLPTFATRWLLKRLPSFQDMHPDIHLHISTTYNAIDFTREDADLAIRYGQGSFGSLYEQLLLIEDLIPVCSPTLLHQKLSREKIREIRPEDLSQFRLLHSETCTLNWKSWLKFAGAPKVLNTAPSTTFDSCMLSFEAACQGLGFAVANRAYVADDIIAGKLVAPFDVQQPNKNGWHIVYPNHNIVPEKIQAFEDWITQQARHCAEEIGQLDQVGGELNGIRRPQLPDSEQKILPLRINSV